MEESINKAVRATENLFPLSLRLSTSTTPRSQQTDQEDFQQRLINTENRAKAAAASTLFTLDLVEELSEPGVPLESLRRAASSLSRESWNDVLEERHSMERCPYPTCRKASTAPYSPASTGTLKLRLKGSSLYDVGSRKSNEPFCSTACQSRSEWFKGFIERGGEGEMLEDVEQRRRTTITTKPIPAKGEDVLRIPRPPSPTPDTTQISIAALSIVEREIPTAAPLPPSLATSQRDFERPSSSSLSSPQSSSFTRPSAKRQYRPSRLTPFASTTTALLASSRQVTPPVTPKPLPPGSVGPVPTFVENDEGTNAEEGEEEWGMEEEEEDDEIERLIEEGLNARKLMLESGQMQ
jgi:hypothetical protein